MTDPTDSGMTDTSITRRGVCPYCGRLIALTGDGTIRRHGSKNPAEWPPGNCLGYGMLPLPEQVS